MKSSKMNVSISSLDNSKMNIPLFSKVSMYQSNFPPTVNFFKFYSPPNFIIVALSFEKSI